MSAATVDDVKRHGRQTREAQRASCRWRHVDDPAAAADISTHDPRQHARQRRANARRVVPERP